MSVNDLPDPKVIFLCVLLGPNLNFRDHIKSISAKASNALFHLRVAKTFFRKKHIPLFTTY
jgi:hypothetical protein